MIRSIVISPRNPRAAAIELGQLKREFPTVRIESRAELADDPTLVRVEEWRDPSADLRVFDERVARATSAGSIGLLVDRGCAEGAALEVLTRYQGLIDRRNDASASVLFDRVLASRLERSAEDRACALDVWQWTLRLAPRASLGLQLAAVFRDARLPLDEPCESPRTPPLRKLLATLAVPTPAARRACALLLRRDEVSRDPELAVFDEAAALSFFSRRSDAALRLHGLSGTRALVRVALHRLRPAVRVRLLHVRLRPEVWRIVEDALRCELRR